MARVKNDEIASTFEAAAPTTAVAKREETTVAIGTFATANDIPLHRTWPTLKVKSPKSQNVQDLTLKDGNITIDLAYRVDNTEGVVNAVYLNMMTSLVVKQDCIKPGAKNEFGRSASFLTLKAAKEAGFVYSEYSKESDLKKSHRALVLVQKPEDRKGLLDADFPIVWKGKRWAVVRQYLDGWTAILLGQQLEACFGNAARRGESMLSLNFELTVSPRDNKPANGGGKIYPLTGKLMPIRNTKEEVDELNKLVNDELTARPNFAEDDPTE